MLETICEVFKEAYNRNWITARDGNASIRWSDRDHMYVTPTAVRKQTLQPEMFVKWDIHGHRAMKYTDISSALRPSGEFPMHYALQRQINTDVRVVLHLHPTHCVAAMYAGIDLQSLLNEFPELSRYTRVGPTVPLLPPVTQELADACVRNIGLVARTGELEYNVIGMDRHGVVAVDTSPWRAFEHIERLDHICRIVLASGKTKML